MYFVPFCFSVCLFKFSIYFAVGLFHSQSTVLTYLSGASNKINTLTSGKRPFKLLLLHLVASPFGTFSCTGSHINFVVTCEIYLYIFFMDNLFEIDCIYILLYIYLFSICQTSK